MCVQMEATECSTGLLGRGDSDSVHMQVPSLLTLFSAFLKYETYKMNTLHVNEAVTHFCVLRLYCRVKNAGQLESCMLGKRPSDVNMRDVANSILLLTI